ncbi:hypothetical protein [Streptomyces sp. NPDC086787]|uniref:hypothetical protein n=1 Tax=Streptomyces sp. NPDC086787 TaxID=3365759 RepID=UPI00381B71C1
MTTTLAKGGNVVLSAAVCRVTLTSLTTGIDVSAVLLGQDGKVRGLENGTGSFKSYGARAVITDGRGSTVTVPLFNNRNLSYWVAIALIDFTHPGGARILHVEKYSGNHVEARPTLYSNGNFRMSTGKVEFKTR